MKRKLLGALVVLGLALLPRLLLAEVRVVRYYRYRSQPKTTIYKHAPPRSSVTGITYKSSNPDVVDKSNDVSTVSGHRARTYSVVRYSYPYRPRYRYYQYYRPRAYRSWYKPRYRYWASYGWFSPGYYYNPYFYPRYGYGYFGRYRPTRWASIRYRSRRPHWGVSIGWLW